VTAGWATCTELYRETFLDHLYGGIYWAATGRGIRPRE